MTVCSSVPPGDAESRLAQFAMDHHLKKQLLSMRSRDETVRAELAADGSLHSGYHPAMEAVHRANAAGLRAILQAHGWPDKALVGKQAAEAAWLVAQHAIAEPEFMRRCRDLVDVASRRGGVPRWQFAYLDDRINVFEGRPQRYGTQVDLHPDGPRTHALANPERVDALRMEVGLAPLQEALAGMAGNPLPSPEEYAAKQADGDAWRRRVGWVG